MATIELSSEIQIEIKNKTDEQLLECLWNSREYNESYVTCISKEISTRGIDLTDLNKKQQERINYEISALQLGSSPNGFVVAAIVVCVVLSFISQIPIIYLLYEGSNLSFSKNKGQFSGKKFYRYSKKYRKIGYLMLIAGVVLFIIHPIIIAYYKSE